MTRRVMVDPSRCVGSGDCSLLAPDAFELDDEDVAEILPGVALLTDRQLDEVVRACPTAAVVVDEG